MKIGIFSGTFDPIHDGHIAFAKEALNYAGVDEVHFLIEPSPRRKKGVSSIKDRHAMLELALKDEKELKNHVEIDDANHDVTQTLPKLRKQFGSQNQLVLLMGADVFEHVPKWKNHQQLIEAVGFVVALRTEDDGEIAIMVKARLKGMDVQILASPKASISSSRIKNAIKRGEEPKGVNPAVLDYIYDHKLYGR